MKNNKPNTYEWNQTKQQERFIIRMIVFAIVTGMTGGIILIMTLLKFYQALTDCGKL